MMAARRAQGGAAQRLEAAKQARAAREQDSTAIGGGGLGHLSWGAAAPDVAAPAATVSLEHGCLRCSERCAEAAATGGSNSGEDEQVEDFGDWIHFLPQSKDKDEIAASALLPTHILVMQLSGGYV